MKLDEGVAAASEGNVGHWKWLNVQFTLTFLAECRAENRTCGGGSAGVGWENVSFLKFPRISHDPCVCFKLVYSGVKRCQTHTICWWPSSGKYIIQNQISHYLYVGVFSAVYSVSLHGGLQLWKRVQEIRVILCLEVQLFWLYAPLSIFQDI